MSGAEGPDRYGKRENLRRTHWLIWAESLVILLLLVGISIEYESNAYLRSWLKSVIGPFGFLLNGTLVGLYAGGMIGYALALLVSRRREKDQFQETIRKGRNEASILVGAGFCHVPEPRDFSKKKWGLCRPLQIGSDDSLRLVLAALLPSFSV